MSKLHGWNPSKEQWVNALLHHLMLSFAKIVITAYSQIYLTMTICFLKETPITSEFYGFLSFHLQIISVRLKYSV